jgi:hypothetical protein
LIGGKERIARLGHGGKENVLAADVHGLRGNATEFLIQPRGTLAGKLLHGMNAQKLKVAQHGRPNGDEVFETAGFYLTGFYQKGFYQKSLGLTLAARELAFLKLHKKLRLTFAMKCR